MLPLTNHNRVAARGLANHTLIHDASHAGPGFRKQRFSNELNRVTGDRPCNPSMGRHRASRHRTSADITSRFGMRATAADLRQTHGIDVGSQIPKRRCNSGA
jgi:hypothetical protein